MRGKARRVTASSRGFGNRDPRVGGGISAGRPTIEAGKVTSYLEVMTIDEVSGNEWGQFLKLLLRPTHHDE